MNIVTSVSPLIFLHRIYPHGKVRLGRTLYNDFYIRVRGSRIGSERYIFDIYNLILLRRKSGAEQLRRANGSDECHVRQLSFLFMKSTQRSLPRQMSNDCYRTKSA